jgi:hypothetical protein
MDVYNAGVDTYDLLLAQWWANLRESGDMETTFFKSAHSLSGFLSFFAPPRILFLDHEEGVVVRAVWLDPIEDGAFLGLWLHPRFRGRLTLKENLGFVVAVHNAAFKRYRVLMALTSTQKVIDNALKLGYTYLGAVPFINGDNSTTHVMYVTPATFIDPIGDLP